MRGKLMVALAVVAGLSAPVAIQAQTALPQWDATTAPMPPEWERRIGTSSALLAQSTGWRLVSSNSANIDGLLWIVTFWTDDAGQTARCLDYYTKDMHPMTWPCYVPVGGRAEP